MKGFYPLASSSKGNSILLCSENTKVLIDCGLSGKRTKESLERIGVDIAEVDAILVTHEHSDHIAGLKVIACKYDIPVFANSETAKAIVAYCNDRPKFKIFSTGEPFEFGDLEIHPFSIPHDTADPVMFTIRCDGWKLGFCTDLGFATTLVKNRLEGCDYLYLEANHDPDLVRNCARPHVYKQRVLGRNGHLSNEACAQLILDIIHPGLKGVTLAHLSSECNTPQLAYQTVAGLLAEKGYDLPIQVAELEKASPPTLFSSWLSPSALQLLALRDQLQPEEALLHTLTR